MRCDSGCNTWLARLMAEGRIALDNDFAIVREYQHKTHASDGSGVGDAFLRWVLHHIDDPARCDIVPIAPDEKLGYAGFKGEEAEFEDESRRHATLAEVGA